MSLFDELLDILETECRTVLHVAHGIKVFNAIEQDPNLLALTGFEFDRVQQLILGVLEGGPLIGDLLKLDGGDRGEGLGEDIGKGHNAQLVMFVALVKYSEGERSESVLDTGC